LTTDSSRINSLLCNQKSTSSHSDHIPVFKLSTKHTSIMDGAQLRDEAAQDRVRAAVEFLDPSKLAWVELIVNVESG
jgi:hypothetical protein